MTREFIITTEFEKCWKAMRLNDSHMRILEQEILSNPQKAPVIVGTGGLRKIRFALDSRGKSGSARVLYVDFVLYEKIYLITAYTKGEQENLTNEQKVNIKKLISYLENDLRKGEK